MDTRRRLGWALALLFVLLVAALMLAPHWAALRESGLKSTWQTVFRQTLYSRVVIFGNYLDDGFIRRGLGGTLAVLASRNPVMGILFFTVFSAAFMVLPLALLIRRLAQSAGPLAAGYLTVVLALSPQTFLGWSQDLVRTDMLSCGFVCWSVLAALDRRRALAFGLLLVGLLVHETAFIFGAPLLTALSLEDMRSQGPIRWRPLLAASAALLAGAAVIVGVQFALSPAPGVLAAKMLQAFPAQGNERMSRDLAIYMALAGSNAVKTAMCLNFRLSAAWPIFVALCFAVLAAYAVILPLWRRPVALLIAVCLPVAFMLVIGNDVGRWLKMGVLNAWLLTAALSVRTPSFHSWRPASMAVGLLLLLGLLTMGHTAYSDVNHVTSEWVGRLGYSFPFTLEQWLDACDAGWRSVVYGASPQR